MHTDDSHTTIFSILEGDPMEQYVSHVQKRRRILAKEKQKLLSPLFEFVNKARKVHLNYYKKSLPRATCEDVEIAFVSTLFGQFEKKLLAIVERLLVLGFNSANYDNVLIYKSLARAIHRRGKILAIRKKGSSIAKLSWTDGEGKIIMTDIAEMLSPGTSLAKFVETADIEMKKGLFPFR